MPLPIDAVLPDVRRHLADVGRVVVSAPTGSGKTTGLPPALLDEDWASAGRIVVLEPRRVAARAVARHLAAIRGERVGGVIGLTTRDDREVSASTRLEIVTEGILTRRLQSDPDLPGVTCVVFDEFHERSAQADLGLAMALDVADLRELRIVVMSATLETERVAEMADAPVVEAATRAHPVTVHHEPPTPGTPIETAVARTVLRAADDAEILVFLPGARQIRRTTELLDGVGGVVLPLFGALPPADQDRALAPDPHGRRRIILATDLAETSLTIDGITLVVDSGLVRSPRFDPRTGMDRLDTVRVSRASADQRAGRAGRTAPGTCIRLWDATERLDAVTPPQIAVTDPAPVLLEAAAWGGIDRLRLLDLPPAPARSQAESVLEFLGALDTEGRITDHGRRLLDLPIHPRLASAVLDASAADRPTAVAVAALLGDRDVLRGRGGPPTVDLGARIDVLEGGPPPPGTDVARGPLHRARAEAKRLGRRVGARGRPDAAGAGPVLAHAYPERVAVRRGVGAFTTAGGRGVRIDERDPLADERFVAVGPLDDVGDDARVHLAAALDEADIRRVPGFPPTTVRTVAWEDGDVVATEREMVGAIELARRPIDPPPGEVVDAILDGIRSEGLDLLPWSPATRSLRTRAQMLHDHLGEPWPDLSDPILLDELEAWVGPFLGTVRRRRDLAKVDVGTALRAAIGWELVGDVDDLAPTHLEVPSGARIRLDYEDAGGLPVLPVKLQEMFGATASPTIAGGRIPVVVHLLSPARRPLQVTTDLAGFWARGYPEVRKEMRGRYPKHPWPEDPLTAEPTGRTRQSRG